MGNVSSGNFRQFLNGLKKHLSLIKISQKAFMKIVMTVFSIDVQNPENLQIFHDDLPFLTERMKIEKFKKLVTNLHDKKRIIMHIRNLKQALNLRLVLEKVQRSIKFNLKLLLKPYTNMNAELRTNAKNDFEKRFFKVDE